MPNRREFRSILKSYLILIVVIGIFSTPLIILISHSALTSQITPNDEFRAVNNFGVPDININTWNLTIDGNVTNPLFCTYDNFTQLPYIDKTVTHQCVSFPLGTAVWRGVTLEYLLNILNPTNDALEVVFYGVDGFTSSLTIEAVLLYDVFLAYEMNGVPLPPEHGFPLRVVAPYHVGYKWVKFLDHIEIVNYDYKGLYESHGYDDVGLLSSAIDWQYHSYLLAIGFFLGGLSSVSAMRYARRGKIFRNLPKFVSMKFHIFTGLLFVFISTLTFVSWLQKTFIFKGRIFYSYHGIVALATMILLLLSYTSGVAESFLKSKKSSWHKNISYLTMLTFFISISAGLLLIFI